MYATPLAFRQLEQRNAQLPSRGQGTGMGYPAGSNAAFEAWVALPAVRAALNVSDVFPDDADARRSVDVSAVASCTAEPMLG